VDADVGHKFRQVDEPYAAQSDVSTSHLAKRARCRCDKLRCHYEQDVRVCRVQSPRRIASFSGRSVAGRPVTLSYLTSGSSGLHQPTHCWMRGRHSIDLIGGS
jgi:hypothetical protein